MVILLSHCVKSQLHVITAVGELLHCRGFIVLLVRLDILPDVAVCLLIVINSGSIFLPETALFESCQPLILLVCIRQLFQVVDLCDKLINGKYL